MICHKLWMENNKNLEQRGALHTLYGHFFFFATSLFVLWKLAQIKKKKKKEKNCIILRCLYKIAKSSYNVKALFQTNFVLLFLCDFALKIFAGSVIRKKKALVYRSVLIWSKVSYFVLFVYLLWTAKSCTYLPLRSGFVYKKSYQEIPLYIVWNLSQRGQLPG